MIRASVSRGAYPDGESVIEQQKWSQVRPGDRVCLEADYEVTQVSPVDPDGFINIEVSLIGEIVSAVSFSDDEVDVILAEEA